MENLMREASWVYRVYNWDQRHEEQRYEIHANRDITFTRLAGDYEIEAAIVSYTKQSDLRTKFIMERLSPNQC